MQDDRLLKAAPGGNVTPLADQPRKYAEAYTVHGSALLGDDAGEISFLVEGCIPRRNIILLTGESGAGKTWVAYELVRAVASGTQWLGRGVACVPETVLVLNYDSPTDTVRFRVRRLAFNQEWEIYYHTLGLTKPPIPSMPQMLKLLEEAGKLKLILQHLKPALIVVDSLRQGHTLNENDNNDMAKLMSVYKAWATDSTVVLIHHTAKTDKSSWTAKSRGSGEIIASSNVVIEVNENKLEWTKSQTWNIGETTGCGFSINDIYVDEASGQPIDDRPGKDSTTDWVEEHTRIKTIVVANSWLPGEQQMATVRAVCGVLETEARIMSATEIAAATKIALPLIQKALADGCEKKLIRSFKNRRGKGYAINNPIV